MPKIRDLGAAEKVARRARLGPFCPRRLALPPWRSLADFQIRCFVPLLWLSRNCGPVPYASGPAQTLHCALDFEITSERSLAHLLWLRRNPKP